MADTGIFATTAEVERKVGANASTVSKAEAYVNDYMTQAESFINSATTFNWSDVYASLNVDVKGILKQAASAFAAIMVIRYDMSGYTSRNEAITMINSLTIEFNEAMKELNVKDKQKFMRNVT